MQVVVTNLHTYEKSRAEHKLAVTTNLHVKILENTILIQSIYFK